MKRLLELSLKLLMKFSRPFVMVFYLHGSTRARVRLFFEDSAGVHELRVKGGFSSQNWVYPGGGVNKDESACQAACRELFEEVGIEVDPDRLALVETRVVFRYRYFHYRVELFELQLDAEIDPVINWPEIIAAEYQPAI